MSWSAIRWAMEASQQARLSTAQRVVLLTLAYHHNDRGGACTPSNETLRAETGLSRRAVQVAVQALEASGLITVAARSVHGIQTSNQYDLFRNTKGRTSCAVGGRTTCAGRGAQETEQQGRTWCTRTLIGPTVAQRTSRRSRFDAGSCHENRSCCRGA